MQREGPLQIIIGKYDVGDKARGPIYVKWVSDIWSHRPDTPNLPTDIIYGKFCDGS